MNILKVLFELFLLYLAYKLVFELIIPAVQVTSQMKRKMSDMQEQLHRQQAEQARQAEQTGRRTATPVEPSPARAGDYIDFEEVKP
jgi:Sec-independent protein translocase protein TatA